ncbi:PREDICTED: uncharacterized protein LOC108756602 isoform X1 [Trachymyrmex septentrionalis]|uniref:uncharacterized protein LOC108756602 isoform X1 n=1 Tax=Trachymyrmex septentrionalis TaxID=34720 RepID=UPI00084F18B4|nr:PREDICTED: uncharacterized protein LOC108756602 isoform X1 [Trachymyrmex septentrionalis]
MRGIYVIVITFLGFWANNEVIAKEDQLEQSILKEGFYEDDIPTRCPYRENTTTIHIPHETDCTKFYKCLWGKRILIECPLIEGTEMRLHYNRREQICDWPWAADCVYCPLQNKNGIWPQSKLSYNTQNCNAYYVCINGNKYLQYCPVNTCFSRTCQNCVVNRSGGNCDL